MLVLGGGDGSTGGSQNDVWGLSLAGGPAWTQLVPSGTPPLGRFLPSGVYEPGQDRLILFGGFATDGNFKNDTWELSLSASPAWTELLPLMPPGPRYSSAFAYDAAQGRLLVFGGYGGANLGDAWALGLGAGQPALTIGDASVDEG